MEPQYNNNQKELLFPNKDNFGGLNDRMIILGVLKMVMEELYEQ
jgi:hypothetical protein